MPLDPEVRESLLTLAAEGVGPVHRLSVSEARKAMEIRTARTAGNCRAALNSVHDVRVPMPDVSGRARIYVPNEPTPQGWVMYLAGGGFVVGDLESHDDICARLASQLHLVVVSYEYRRAPENPYPGPIHDAFHAALQLQDIVTSYDCEATVIYLAGDSAGANLAANMAIYARDRGSNVVKGQLLYYPVFDPECARTSWSLYGNGAYPLPRDDMLWYWRHYLADSSAAPLPYVDPTATTTLSQLPPGIVVTAEFDPARDDGEAYARALQLSGVDIRHIRFAALPHGFLGYHHDSVVADRAIDTSCEEFLQLIG